MRLSPVERQRGEANLRCRYCDAQNRPGQTVIEVEANGLAWCGVCARSFPVVDAVTGDNGSLTYLGAWWPGFTP